MEKPDEQQPEFESLDEFCEAYGFDAKTRERMRADLELSVRPPLLRLVVSNRNVNEALH